MKHHLNIILLALRIGMVVAAIEAVYQFVFAVFFFTADGPEIVKEFFSSYFTPIAKSVPYRNNEWFGAAFCLIHSGLLLYVTLGLRRLYKCLRQIKKGEMFYHTQGDELRKAGAAVIIFAKSKYLLLVTMGTMVYVDLAIFFTEIPAFLALYLSGKFILLMSYMAEKGEYIKEEVDLTI
jgi:hypothetical protein